MTVLRESEKKPISFLGGAGEQSGTGSMERQRKEVTSEH